MKKRLFSGIMAVVMLVCVFSVSGCGKIDVQEYKTKHHSGTYEVNDFTDLEKLFFKRNCSPEEIAKIIPDFCIYEDGKNYRAEVPVSFSGLIQDYGIIRLYTDKYLIENSVHDCWKIDTLNYEEFTAKNFTESGKKLKLLDESGNWKEFSLQNYRTYFFMDIAFNADKEFKDWKVEYYYSLLNPLCGTELFLSTLSQHYELKTIKAETIVDYYYNKTKLGECINAFYSFSSSGYHFTLSEEDDYKSVIEY